MKKEKKNFLFDVDGEESEMKREADGLKNSDDLIQFRSRLKEQVFQSNLQSC